MSGAPSSRLFRQVSLDRLASPDQLDQMVQVASRRSWSALLALCGVIVVAIAWSVTGRIPDTVSGTGMLARSGGVFEVAPTSGGRLLDLAVDVGDLVSEGQVVARIQRDDLAEQLRQARMTLRSLESQRTSIDDFGSRDMTVQLEALSEQRVALAQSLAAGEKAVRWLDEKLAAQEPLAQKGLITRGTLMNTRQERENTRGAIGDTRTRISQLDVRRLELDRRLHDELQGSSVHLGEQRLVIEDIERQLRIATEVISPASGRVLETLAERGGVVSAGEPLLTVDLAGRGITELQAVVFVPSEQGKRIRPGMTIRIAPATVKQEEFGMMLGRVTYVSDFPATSKGMRRVLKNDALVGTLSQGDTPYEVHADLIPDPSTPSRYRWTSASGPPMRIQSGTLAQARIEVASRRPMEMVVPFVRRHTGI